MNTFDAPCTASFEKSGQRINMKDPLAILRYLSEGDDEKRMGVLRHINIKYHNRHFFYASKWRRFCGTSKTL